MNSRLLQSSSCSPGCVHLRQPGVRSPRGTNCNVDVRGRRLASAGGGTYPQKCRCSSEAECLQVVIRRLIVAKLRFLNCTNPHVSNEYAHVAFQLIRKLKRIAAPHFCSTFLGEEKGSLFFAWTGFERFFQDRSERRKQHKLFTVGFRAAALTGRFNSARTYTARAKSTSLPL